MHITPLTTSKKRPIRQTNYPNLERQSAFPDFLPQEVDSVDKVSIFQPEELRSPLTTSNGRFDARIPFSSRNGRWPFNSPHFEAPELVQIGSKKRLNIWEMDGGLVTYAKFTAQRHPRRRNIWRRGRTFLEDGRCSYRPSNPHNPPSPCRLEAHRSAW